MKTAVVFLLSLVSGTHAFVVPGSPTIQTVHFASTDEDDYDAPTDRAAAVGNLVQSKPPSVMGLPIPSFLVKTFGIRFGDDGATAHDNDKLFMSDMDDECYLGKDGTLEECADFDPPAEP